MRLQPALNLTCTVRLVFVRVTTNIPTALALLLHRCNSCRRLLFRSSPPPCLSARTRQRSPSPTQALRLPLAANHCASSTLGGSSSQPTPTYNHILSSMWLNFLYLACSTHSEAGSLGTLAHRRVAQLCSILLILTYYTAVLEEGPKAKPARLRFFRPAIKFGCCASLDGAGHAESTARFPPNTSSLFSFETTSMARFVVASRNDSCQHYCVCAAAGAMTT